MRKTIQISCLVLFIVVWYSAVQAQSLASKMASIDGSSDISRYDYLLKTLEKKTTSSQSEIGDMTAKAKMVYREDFGRDIKLITIMEGVNNSIPSGSKKQDYAGLASVYITMVGNRR